MLWDQTFVLDKLHKHLREDSMVTRTFMHSPPQKAPESKLIFMYTKNCLSSQSRVLNNLACKTSFTQSKQTYIMA